MNLKLQPLVAPLIALAGGIVVGFLGHSYTAPEQRYEVLVDRRTTAYTKWLAVREEMIGDPDSAAESRAQVVLNELVTYGDRNVVDAIYDYARSLEHYAPLEHACEPDWELDAAIYRAMRSSLLGDKERVNDREIALFILRCNAELGYDEPSG